MVMLFVFYSLSSSALTVFFRKDEFDKRDKGLDALISALFRAIRTSYIVKSTKLKAKLLSKQNVVVKTIIPSKKENVFWEYRL